MIDDSNWKAFKAKFKASQKNRQSRIVQALSAAAELPLSRAKTHYLTGGALNVQTGRLRSSVTKNPSIGANKVNDTYQVSIGTNVFYGRAWEEGFKVPPRIIAPVEKQALRFMIGGQEVFAKRVYQPARNEKARPWLWPSIVDTTEQMKNILAAAGVILE